LKHSLYKNEYKTFKLVESTVRKGLKKKNRGNEPNQAIKCTYMEVPQEIPSAVILNKQNIISFSYLLQNRKTKGQSRSCVRWGWGMVVVLSVGVGRRWGKGVRQ
jgi:hypothetical protein